MRWSATCVLLAAMIYGGGGVTKTSGIEQFWTDDYKVFEQVYGKTSDKDIYGETLPASVTFTRDKAKEASEKNERFLINYNDPDAEQFDSYNFGDNYNDLLTKQSLKLLTKKPATSAINFVSYSNFKPISQANDPETYNYLKHLEEFNKEEKYDFPKTIGGFKPYLSHEVMDPEQTDAYKSIQDILDAHEGNKGGYKVEEDNNMKYLTYPKNKRKKPPRVYNEVNKPRCTEGRCRKRGASYYRSRSRPYRRSPSVKTVVVI